MSVESAEAVAGHIPAMNTMYEVGLVGAERSSIMVEAQSPADAVRAARALVPDASGATWMRLADDHRLTIPDADHYEVWVRGTQMQRNTAAPDRMSEQLARAIADQFNAEEAELARTERRPVSRIYVVVKATVSREVIG